MSLSTYGSDPPHYPMSRRVLRGFSAHAFAAVRTQANFTISDLARLADVAVSTLHHWEAGTRSPQIDILAKVMTVLQAPIESVVLIPCHERYPGDWRVMTGRTQPQLAAAAGMPTALVTRIERADYPLSDTNAETLATALGVSAAEYKAAYQRARDRHPGIPA